MKMIGRISLVLIFSFNLFASEYQCPPLPISGKVGNKVTDGWTIQFQSDGTEQNLLSKYYQKYFGKEYEFESWFGLNFFGYPEMNGYLLQCCSFAGKKDVICVGKIVKSTYCSIAEGIKERAFICKK